MLRSCSWKIGKRCITASTVSNNVNHTNLRTIGIIRTRRMNPTFFSTASDDNTNTTSTLHEDGWSTNTTGRVHRVSVTVPDPSHDATSDNHKNRNPNRPKKLDHRKSSSSSSPSNNNPRMHKSKRGNRNRNPNSNHKRKKKPTKTNTPNYLAQPNLLSEWVAVTNISPLSTLDDLLMDVTRIMSTERSVGIVDLDLAEELLRQYEVELEASGDTTMDPPQLPLWEPHTDDFQIGTGTGIGTGATYEDDYIPSHLVVEAHMMLSTLKRPMGWYLRFPNRSCVHALLSHIDEAEQYAKANKNFPANGDGKENESGKDENDDAVAKPLMCAWKKVTVEPFFLDSHSDSYSNSNSNPFYDPIKYRISDRVIRVENCAIDSDVDDVKYFFHRYNLKDDRDCGDGVHGTNDLQSVVRVVEGQPLGGRKPHHRHPRSHPHPHAQKNQGVRYAATPSSTNAFLVTFASAADARSAVREKQNVEFMGRRLRLAHYSRQILRLDNDTRTRSNDA